MNKTLVISYQFLLILLLVRRYIRRKLKKKEKNRGGSLEKGARTVSYFVCFVEVTRQGIFLQVNRMVNLSFRVHHLVWYMIFILHVINCGLYCCFWCIADDRLFRSHKTFFSPVFQKNHRPDCEVELKSTSQACRRQMHAIVVVADGVSVLICRISTPDSTGDCVAGSSAAHENQA